MNDHLNQVQKKTNVLNKPKSPSGSQTSIADSTDNSTAAPAAPANTGVPVIETDNHTRFKVDVVLLSRRPKWSRT